MSCRNESRSVYDEVGSARVWLTGERAALNCATIAANFPVASRIYEPTGNKNANIIGLNGSTGSELKTMPGSRLQSEETIKVSDAVRDLHVVVSRKRTRQEP